MPATTTATTNHHFTGSARLCATCGHTFNAPVHSVPSASATTGTTGSALVAAVEAFWSMLVEEHPELPARVIVVTGSGRMGLGLVRGHWAKERWNAGAERLPELFVSGERMADGGRGVATTTIHEAAHALLIARGDATGGTSRQGRYHTAKGFGAAAVELGLEMPAKADATLGFSDCTMPEATAAKYAERIEALDAALDAVIDNPFVEAEARACWIGLVMGAWVGVEAWWGAQGGGLAGTTRQAGRATRAPRQARTVEVSCGCRTLRLPVEATDIECSKCGEVFA